MYKVYVIYSSNFGRYYVGITNNIEVRIKQHNSGKTQSTKAYIPWEVILIEDCETRSAAREREKYLKSAAGRRWRKLNIRPRGATEYPPVPEHGRVGVFGGSWHVRAGRIRFYNECIRSM